MFTYNQQLLHRLRINKCLFIKRTFSMKHITDKERELSFVLNTFRGEILSDQMFPYPDVLNSESKKFLKMLVDPVEKFFASDLNNPLKYDEAGEVPKEVLSKLWELGVFSLQVPPELGGLGLSNTQYTRLVQIIGSHDLSLGITLGAHQSIGFKGILLFGTNAQKEKYLPRVSSGEFAAFCLTEPSAGSDAGSIKSRAVLSDDKKYYILNGSKIWISNGGIAEIFTLFAQTPIDNVDKVTAFIVERSFGGITSGPSEKKMGIKACNTTDIFFENVKVPVENVLGGVGFGFKVAMNILNNGRFGMAAALGGTMRTCIKKAVEFAANRVQFKNKLKDFQGIQEKISTMAMLQYVTESMAYMVAGNMDEGSKHYHIEAAVSKCFASEAAWYVCDEAIQIMGGMGYMRETGLELILRDLRIFRIFEGANDVLKLFIALNGIRYAGEQLKELQKVLKNPLVRSEVFVNFATRRVYKRFGLHPTKNFDDLVHADLVLASKYTARAINDFSIEVERMLMRFSKDIINQQSVLTHLANSVIFIYGSVVALSRATSALNKKTPTADHEKAIAIAFCIDSYNKVKYHLKCISGGGDLHNYLTKAEIAKVIFENGGLYHQNPLGF